MIAFWASSVAIISTLEARGMPMMKLTDLSDIAAESECRRLLMVVNARRKRDNAWFNYDESPIVYDDDSAFVVGMKSLFRYARGESIPPFVVRDYLSQLLDLLFAGIASGALALPALGRWAIALGRMLGAAPKFAWLSKPTIRCPCRKWRIYWAYRSTTCERKLRHRPMGHSKAISCHAHSSIDGFATRATMDKRTRRC